MTPDEIAEKLRAGLDGIAQGRYTLQQIKGYCIDYILVADDPALAPTKEYPHRNVVAETGITPGQPHDMWVKHSQHLLNCSPENIAALLADRDRMREALRPFAEIPLNGTFGGPLCAIKALYEDGSDETYTPDRSQLGHEAVYRVRAALSEAGGGKSGDGEQKP